MKQHINQAKIWMREKGVPILIGIFIGHMNWHIWVWDRAQDIAYHIEEELQQEEERTLLQKLNPFDGE